MCRNHITFQPNTKAACSRRYGTFKRRTFYLFSDTLLDIFFYVKLKCLGKFFFPPKKILNTEIFFFYNIWIFLNTRSSNFFGFSLPACFFHMQKDFFSEKKKIFKNSPPDLPKNGKKGNCTV